MKTAASRFRIPVLLPDLPSAQDLMPLLQRIDEARWYTNFGPLARRLESALARHLGNDAAAVCLNCGTTALELGIAALSLPAGA